MEPPAITRSRRPFLAPIWVMALFGLAVLGLAVLAWRSLTTTTVVVLRHAEKELGSIEDSPLAPQGELRAERLAQMLGEVTGAGQIEAIYVSGARRTQQTAAPLAARLRLQPVVLPGGNADELADRLLDEHRGGVVLVVSHANVIPALVQRLAGIEVPPMPDDEYDQIYVVSVPTLGKASLLTLKY